MPESSENPESAGTVAGEIVVPSPTAPEARVSVRSSGATVREERSKGGAFKIEYVRNSEEGHTLEVAAPRMKPVSVPLPTGKENVGRIVLRPTLAYRGTVTCDGVELAGALLSLRNRLGIAVGSGRVADSGREFEVRLTSMAFSRLRSADGAYSKLSLTIRHDDRSFQSVAARPEGFGAGHDIQLVPIKLDNASVALRPHGQCLLSTTHV